MTVLDSDKRDPYSKDPSYDKIVTIPNLISLVRLCLIPLYMVLLFAGHDLAAAIVFGVAAASDFLDGQVARRTHSVSRVGKLLDPAIDTLLMITGVLGTCIVGRVPIWIAVFVFARELFLLCGGAVLLRHFKIQVPVVYPGKVATTLLFFGFAGMILYMPVFQGLGICDISWLPGFDHSITSWGIYLIYAGLILQLGVTIYYCFAAYRQLKSAMAAKDEASRQMNDQKDAF